MNRFAMHETERCLTSNPTVQGRKRPTNICRGGKCVLRAHLLVGYEALKITYGCMALNKKGGRKMKKLFALTLLGLFLSGCATALSPNYSPVVDFKMSKKTQAQYQSDLAECKALASKRMSAAKAAAVGTGIGAALGAGIGAATSAIFGVDIGQGAAAGALVGGVSGVGAGAKADIDQKQIIINCLSGRGYAVMGR